MRLGVTGKPRPWGIGTRQRLVIREAGGPWAMEGRPGIPDPDRPINETGRGSPRRFTQ